LLFYLRQPNVTSGQNAFKKISDIISTNDLKETSNNRSEATIDSDNQEYNKLIEAVSHDLARLITALPASRSQDTKGFPGSTETFELTVNEAAWLEEKRKLGEYNVFMCHNSEDKPEVQKVGLKLIQRHVVPWLDEWDLRPGLPWQEALEAQIGQLTSAAVFVGSSGFGPWQNMELAAFLREFVSRRCPVIPVILATCSSLPQLPTFPRSFTWVDFRKTAPEPLGQLIWGITGNRPSEWNCEGSILPESPPCTKRLGGSLMKTSASTIGRQDS
jgi:hypothetical protein